MSSTYTGLEPNADDADPIVAVPFQESEWHVERAACYYDNDVEWELWEHVARRSAPGKQAFLP